jgi:hypothetical protein
MTEKNGANTIKTAITQIASAKRRPIQAALCGR